MHTNNFMENQVKDFLTVYEDEIRTGMAKREVLEFIARFRLWTVHDPADERNAEVIRQVFASGYCFYFAHMLRLAFNRGKIVLAAPKGHIVWLDDDGCAYDIDGIFKDYYFEIPVEALGDGIEDCMHVPGKTHYNTKEDVIRLLKEYAPNEELLEKALYDVDCNWQS